MEVTKIVPIGYCKGVSQAINTVYDVIKKYPNQPIYCLGQIVHNHYVNQQLIDLGVHLINQEKEHAIANITKGVVIFSAHGTNPKIIQKAKDKGLIVIDTTCPFVQKEIDIVQHYLRQGYRIIYIGKKNHPEAQAICSLSHKVNLIEKLDDVKNLKININEQLFITNQTTISLLDLTVIFDYFKNNFPNAIVGDELCSSTRLRQEAILKIDKKFDGIIIVGDQHSNNCKNLFYLATLKHNQVLMISNQNDLNWQWLIDKKNIAIFSGASTPIELVNEIENKIKNFHKKLK